MSNQFNRIAKQWGDKIQSISLAGKTVATMPAEQYDVVCNGIKAVSKSGLWRGWKLQGKQLSFGYVAIKRAGGHDADA